MNLFTKALAFTKRKLAWVRKNKLLIAAGILTAGEALVGLGVPLPGAEAIDIEYRGVLIALTISMAFVLRSLALRREEKEEREEKKEERDGHAPG